MPVGAVIDSVAENKKRSGQFPKRFTIINQHCHKGTQMQKHFQDNVVACLEAKEILSQNQMAGAAHRQELCQALKNTQENAAKQIHNSLIISAEHPSC
jgi:hypothetical protein